MINRNRLISLTQKIIQIDSQNPPGNEVAIAEFIKQDLFTLGLDIEMISFTKGRPNIIATLKGTLPRKLAQRQAILITPHTDTVPIGVGWKYPPLGGKIHKGNIYGRGATDDKGNLTSCMEVLHSLIEDKVQLKGDIVLAATADEETGSHNGIIPLLEKKILKPKVALIMDSDEFDTIISQKGLIHMRIQISGKKAHAAYNWRGINAIELATDIIQKLLRHQFQYTKHKILHPPTKNIGTIHGGDKVNMVADYCEFALDIRYLPGMNPYKILREVKDIIRTVTKNFKIEIDDFQYPYEIDPQHPFVKAYVHTAKKMGYKTTLKGSEGATVITFFKKHGIPAFATGYGSSGTAHTTDEYVNINNLYRGTRLLEAFLKEYDSLSN